jgi:hypothetical protein
MGSRRPRWLVAVTAAVVLAACGGGGSDESTGGGTPAPNAVAGADPVDRDVVVVVEELSATDQRMTTPGDQFTSVTVLRYLETEVQLVSLDITAGPVNKAFHPAAPVTFAPLPGTPGQSWSWTITSTDGLTTVDQTSTIVGPETITVAGETFETIVVDTTLTISGDISATLQLTNWVRPADKLAVRTHSVSQGSYGVFTFSGDTVSELVALTPT